MKYCPNPVDTSQVELPELIKRETEFLAENVHENWAAKKISHGWKYGTPLNEETKVHPSLVPYDQLPESEKEYDRKTALETIKLLLWKGYKIVR
ncbi:MAG: RyR domain-containing protein [Vulcanimicrobiota bacterium]